MALLLSTVEGRFFNFRLHDRCSWQLPILGQLPTSPASEGVNARQQLVCFGQSELKGQEMEQCTCRLLLFWGVFVSAFVWVFRSSLLRFLVVFRGPHGGFVGTI